MITNDEILFLIITAVLFFQGFYVARKQVWRVVIVSLILIILDLVSIMSNGDYTLSDATLNITVHNVVGVIIYAIFWWGLGYIMGHFILIRDGDIGKVKIIKLEEIKQGKELD